MRSSIDLLTDQLESTGQQVTYLRTRLSRIESSNMLLIDQIKQVVDVPESSINVDDPTGWQEDKYHKIRKHLQQLISQAERTLVSNGLEDTEEVLVDDDHTAVNHKIKLNQNESESISRQFTELMKAVDENGEYVCARCHAKPKKEDNKNHLQLVAAKLGIPEDFIITLLRMAPYLARHAFSAFTVLTAILPALRSILGRRKAKLLPKMKVVSVNRTKKAILSEVVYFTILVITYTREIFGEDGAFSAIILRGKELWQAVTNRDTTDINADSDDTERRQRMLCNFGNLVNKLYAFIETNERNEKNVKKVVSNTVKVESIVGKLTKASSARSSPLMSLATLIIYAAGIVGAWQVSKRSSLS
ncbi:hypothetical protein NQZ79_g6691 [Umbelopsis isabellina]|nr:hypothetical protein NQZ79_g6691 [Umbelopsis isabellina]